MKIFKENDSTLLTRPIAGEVIGERREITLQVGTLVTVVLVHGDPEQPKAYEIEGYIQEQDCYVLATIEAGNI